MWRPPVKPPARPVERIVSIVARIGHLSGGNCLNRSLIAYRLLSRAGADPILTVGVAKTEEVVGHTWVSIAGVPLLDEPGALAKYTEIVSFGSNGRRVN